MVGKVEQLRKGHCLVLVPGAIGGITGGINAVKQGREFWSGKQWNEVSIGFGADGNTSPFHDVNYEDYAINWDTDVSMKIPHTGQYDSYSCAIRCKMSTDSYFGLTDQSTLNNRLLDVAKAGNGLSSGQVLGLYRSGGYNVNQFSGNISKQSALKWMVGEMRANHAVQASLKAQNASAASNQYHAVVVKRVRYLSDFSRFKISIMNPSADVSVYPKLINAKNYNQLFSVYR